jgi:hypothetical protein
MMVNAADALESNRHDQSAGQPGCRATKLFHG